jgi:hypothetical protein
MADIALTGLTRLTNSTIAAGDLLLVEDIDGAETKAITAQNLGKYVLGNRTIGGTATGDIVTIDGPQTLTAKRLDGVKLNDTVPLTTNTTELNLLDGLTASATDLNKLSGLATTKAELGYVANATSNLQAQINALVTPSGNMMFYQQWCFSKLFTASAAAEAVTATTMLTALGLDTNAYAIDPSSLNIMISTYNQGRYTMRANSTGTYWTTTTIGTQTILDTVTVGGLAIGSEYGMSVSFCIANRSGGGA